MKKHQNVYTMNSAQKKRYLIFCVGILAIMIISYSIRLPSQRQHNARMLNISLPDYNLLFSTGIQNMMKIFIMPF